MTKNDPRPIENNRSKAIEWWNKQTTLMQIKCTSDFISKERSFATLTGREIETIWNCVHIKAQL